MTIDLDTGDAVVEEVKRTVWDPIHFSDLSCMSQSPAHFKASVESGIKSSRDMRVGSVVHHLVLGAHTTRPCIRYEDGEDRKGNAYKKWAKEQLVAFPRATLVTIPEWRDAEAIAASVLADPVAGPMIAKSRREVEVKWDLGGIACETDGIDLVGDGWIADLKRTSSTEPDQFARHGAKSLWHCQVVFYETGANAMGFDTSRGLYLIGVEPDPPYAVTVMHATPRTIKAAHKSLTAWLEKLRSSRDNDFWPTYTQTVVPFELPEWMQDDEDEESFEVPERIS